MAIATLSVHCDCKHTYQDALYGKGIRVAVPPGSSARRAIANEVKCTVCGTSHRQFQGTLYKGTGKKGGSGSGAGRAKLYLAKPPKDGWKGGLPEDNGCRK